MADLYKSSLFYLDQHLCYAEIVPPSEVRARIEVAVLKFLKILASPTPAISDLALISRTSSNSRLRRGLLIDVSSIFLSHSFCTMSLMRNNAARAFVRVWKVMELVLKILVQEKQVTERELFYKLLCDSPDYFTSPVQVNRSLQDVVALLRCSRQSLGIIASSRGAVVGRLLMQEPNQEILDCSAIGSAGHAITGDLHLLEKLVFRSDARYLIVVEKDAIFQRLAEDRLFDQIPSILITAKGYPDLASRNPAGLAILCTYKLGSIRMGLEAYRYACNVKWLGLRGDDLHLIPQHSLVRMKQRDFQIAKGLISSKMLQDKYKEELNMMVEVGHRVEIEALYFHGYDFLAKYISRKIVQGDYI